MRHDATPIACQTISTAQSAGWIWDIGLADAARRRPRLLEPPHLRRGGGARAARLHRAGRRRTCRARKIPIRSGHRETFWKRNCVAVGLAAGFLEPLESSAIVLIELSAKLIAEQMPVCREVMDVIAARFNATTHYRWGRIIDFLKLHYVLTKRTDSAFWRDNLLPETIPGPAAGPAAAVELPVALVPRRVRPRRGSLSGGELPVRALRHGLPHRGGTFGALTARRRTPSARCARTPSRPSGLRAGLPRHRDLIRKIVEHGLQAV